MRPKAEALGYPILAGTKEGGEGGVEGSEGGGRGEVNGGDEDGFEAAGAEGVGERRGLVRGAGDEDAGHRVESSSATKGHPQASRDSDRSLEAGFRDAPLVL
jgi:hypothetical protein